jgi:hypothetical protein
MCNPKIMCRKHLMGEHVECHMFIGSLKKGKKLEGHTKNNQLDICLVIQRHNELVNEMITRGYNHKTPFTNEHQLIVNNALILYEKNNWFSGKINPQQSLGLLLSRCNECKERYNKNI